MQSKLLIINENDLKNAELNLSSSFEEFNIWERSHIQEWIRKYPTILGEELEIITTEFSNYTNSKDRLDVLALDRKGNLVLIELKRNHTGGYADLQALRYASMVSSMTMNDAAKLHLDYHRKYYPEKFEDENNASYEALVEFITQNENFDEIGNKVRIILCSENFSTELTHTILWLRNEYKLDISCVRIRPHKVNDSFIVVPSVIIPIPESEQYLIKLNSKKEEIDQEKLNRTKRKTSIRLLVDENLLKVGDVLTLDKNKVPQYLVEYLELQSENYYQAEITGKTGKANNVKWCFDGNEYSISGLTHVIFESIHPDKQHPGALAGADYWVNSKGQNLYQWANEVWAEK